MKKKIGLLLGTVVLSLGLAACDVTEADTEADTVNYNLSESADSFEVQRRIVFFNGITDKYLLEVEGRCSLDIGDNKNLKVTCKVGQDEYKRHYLGLSDNVSYFVEQMEGKKESAYHYKVTFRPETILPDIKLRTSGDKD